MAEAAKVIRIELRATGGGSSSNRKNRNKKAKEKKPPKLDNLGLTKSQNLAGASVITFANQMLSYGISLGETLSYNSQEKTNMLVLDIQKKAISTALITGGYLLGGPIGSAVGLAVKQFVIDPIAKGGEISIRRNLDYTRATNRFYLTDFAGKGNYTFDYASGSYINEDLQKVINSSFYKKGRGM